MSFLIRPIGSVAYELALVGAGLADATFTPTRRATVPIIVPGLVRCSTPSVCVTEHAAELPPPAVTLAGPKSRILTFRGTDTGFRG